MTDSSSSIASQVDFLNGLGSRLTGSPGHSLLLEHIAETLGSLGYPVHRDPHTFTRWTVAEGSSALAITVAGEELQVSSAFPYSGRTPAEGVTGKLTLLRGFRKNWKLAAGGIAVVEVPHAPLPHNTILSPWNDTVERPAVDNPVFSATLFSPDLIAAKKAGVLAVVLVWHGLSAPEAAEQYLPFTKPYQDIPALWVAGEVAARLLRAANDNQRATVRLEATLTPDVPIETMWTVSPGRRRAESILVVTHTDGTNAVEENGHIGALALARQAAASPHERDIIFVFTTGHLRIPAVSEHGQATSTWLNDHRELWAGEPGGATAIAGLVIEHLGARELRVNGGNELVPTGRHEEETLYATTAALNRLVQREWTTTTRVTDVSRPSALIHFGEGEPLYERGIPAVALVTGPQYLLAEIDGDLVDLELMQDQIDGFGRLLTAIDSVENSGEWGPVQQYSRWQKLKAKLAAALLIRKIVTAPTKASR